MAHGGGVTCPQVTTINGVEYVSADWARSLWVENRELRKKLAEKQRTDASHKQQFAEIRDLWENLPERLGNMPYAKSAEHFRKHGLIQTGHCDVASVVCAGDTDAAKLESIWRREGMKAHGYVICVRIGNAVTLCTPHSQSYAAMGKDLFQKSKADVLEWCKKEVGV